MTETWKRLVALGVLACLVTFSFSCASVSQGGDYFGQNKPPHENIFRYVTGDEPQSLDPPISIGQPEARIYMALYDGLVEYDPKNLSPIPSLAERWDVNSDSSEFTFHLRQNGRFSNGDPIDANDFVYQWESSHDYNPSAGMEKIEAYGIKLDKGHAKLQELIDTLKDREGEGYQFEAAEGSFELLMRKAMGTHRPSFQLLGFRVIVEKKHDHGASSSEATVMVKVGELVEHAAAVGAGPVNALDHALRKALEKFYPQLREVKLLDYKVRVLSANSGTESKVRVLIESGDHKDKWGTVGVSENIMEASWQALADSIEYKLLAKDE